MIENLPEDIVIGDLELLFLGLALGAGAPRIARRILARSYGSDAEPSDHPDCPHREECE